MLDIFQYLWYNLFSIYELHVSGFNSTPVIDRHYTDRYSYYFIYYFRCYDLGDIEENNVNVVQDSG
jgi:hypothetical protein